MNKQMLVLFGTTVALIAIGAAALDHMHGHQKLAPPGVKTRPLPGTQNVEVVLPEKVLDYESELVEVSEIETNTLPKDTSFGKRLYTSPGQAPLMVNVVLMGTDRTSLHKPQFCLEGQGWRMDQAASLKTNVLVAQPYSYQLPVVELIGSREGIFNGQKGVIRCVYVYYYVADGSISAGMSGAGRMWEMARDLLRTGVLQRWAYVSYMTYCSPGQEEAAFERIQRFIAAAAPEFQLTPQPKESALSS